MFLSVEDVSAIYPDENNKESDTCIILVNLKNTNNAEQKRKFINLSKDDSCTQKSILDTRAKIPFTNRQIS